MTHDSSRRPSHDGTQVRPTFQATTSLCKASGVTETCAIRSPGLVLSACCKRVSTKSAMWQYSTAARLIYTASSAADHHSTFHQQPLRRITILIVFSNAISIMPPKFLGVQLPFVKSFVQHRNCEHTHAHTQSPIFLEVVPLAVSYQTTFRCNIT